MFRLKEPATWPQEGDRLWLPWVSPIAFTVAGCHIGPEGKPKVKFIDGTVDDLLGWQYYPQKGDRVIVAAQPLYELYPEHWNGDRNNWLILETFEIQGLGNRPFRGAAAEYTGTFFRIAANDRDPINLPDICCAVISLRHGAPSVV